MDRGLRENDVTIGPERSMGAAGHLRIELEEYDQKICTFVPHYETLLERTAGTLSLLRAPVRTLIDLGIGTGALTEACLAVCPGARVVGVDADPGMLDAARHRLGGHANVELRLDSFLRAQLPFADAVVACIALHHIAEPARKQALYRRIFEALRPGGIFVSGDCYTSAEPGLAAAHRDAWLAHLERTYSSDEARGYLEAWSGEDTYFPLSSELDWLSAAGFTPEVIWRAAGFAVVAGIRER
jgi:tRNA (cmo5U34)-methyltransferase